MAHCHLSRRRRRCRRVQLFDFAVGGCNKYNKRGSRHFWLSSRHLDAERVQSPSRNSFPGTPSPLLSMAVVKGFVSLSHDSAMQRTHTHTHRDRICGTGQGNRKVYFLFATVSPSCPFPFPSPFSFSLFLSFSVHAQLFYKINFPIAD